MPIRLSDISEKGIRLSDVPDEGIRLSDIPEQQESTLEMKGIGLGPMWDEPGDKRTMRERLGYGGYPKPISPKKDITKAIKETPQNLWIGTVGMSASFLEAIKREGMRWTGGGILPDEMVRHQFEAVAPSKREDLSQGPLGLLAPDRLMPGAITSEAFGLTTRLPDVTAKIIRDYQQKLIKEQDEVTLSKAPITKLFRSVTQSGVPSMSVALGLSLLTNNPMVGLGVLGVIEGGAAGEQQLQEGGSVLKAMIIGDLSAAAEIGGEMLVFPKFVRGLKEGIPFAQALTLIVENAGQEGATGFTQRFLEVFGTQTTKGMATKEAAQLAFKEGVKAIPENAWVGGATAGLVDLVSTGTGRMLRGPELKESLQKKAGVSPKVATRAVEMLKEGWEPGEIDRVLIGPSKFIGDLAIDQIVAKERPIEQEQFKKDIAEIDAELAEIQETPPTRVRQAPQIAPEPITKPEAVEVAPEGKKGKFKSLIPVGTKGEYFNLNEETGQVSFLVPFKAEPARGIDPRYRATPVQATVADLDYHFAKLDKTIQKAYAKWRDIFAKENPDKYNELINQPLTEKFLQPKKLAQPPTVAKLTKAEEKPSELTKPVEIAPKVAPTEEVTDEALSGITKIERRRLIKDNAAKIESSDIYQNEVAGLEVSAREVGPGYYYIDKGYKGEVEAIIGKRKGFPNKIQRMFTFDPSETHIITLPDGSKAEVGPQPWESAVQEGLGRGKEGVDTTWGEMDISEFVQRVVDSLQAQETVGGINALALEKAEESGQPDLQLWAEKHRMLVANSSDNDINEMVTEWAAEWGIALEDIEGEFVSEYGTKIRQIKQMAEPDAALEQLATEQIEKEDRQNAVRSAKEVLEANDITAEVEEVEDIRPRDLLGKPVLEGGAAGKQRGLGELGLEFTKPEVKDPDQLEFGDTIPFERRGRPVGAAITQGQKQVILLAYGADSETGYHEGYHILRRRLTENNTKVLDKYFKGDEEAEAVAFAEYVKKGKTKTFLRGIWQKLRNVLRKVKSGMMGRGFRTAEDIFKGIRSGKIEKIPARAGIAFETSGEKLRREAEKSARVKARKARLAKKHGIKIKKVSRRRLQIKLQDHTPPLRADLAPPAKAMPEAAEERPLTTKTLVKPVYTEKWFEENLKREKRSILDKAGSEARRAWLGMEKVFSSSSTRLNNIAPKLFRATRQYIYNVLTRSTLMTEDVSDFVKATRKMSKDDWRQLDLALKNGIDWKTDQLIAKYGLTEQFQTVRVVLDEIFDAAKEVGIDIDYRKNYWPRVLKDPEGFLMYFQGREDWSIIEEAIKRRATQAGRKIEDLTVDEKAHVVNTLLRGYRTQALTLSRPGPAKERTVESIDKKLDSFYDDSRTALHKYIKLMNAKIAEREFFGRETKELQDLRKTQSARLTRLLKLKRRIGLKAPSEPAYKEHISKTAQAWKEGQERLERLKARPLSETIGGYVMRLQAEGEISPTQEKEIQDILKGIFDPQRMGSRMGVFATGVYLDTLNSPLQALTQLDEFAYSFYRSPLRSIPVAIRTAARKSKITPRDIGITSIGEEFQGPSMKRALTLLLKSTGFEMVDRLNKENYINTVLSKYQAQAKRKNLNATFVNRIRKVFGDDYKGVLEDLQNDRISDNVKYLLFNEILDIQPIAITEMPEAYNKAGNMRILYSLKTFYMKRLDFIRNECFKDMKSKETFAQGFGKLVWLAGSFALMGAGSDLLKDFIRGKPFDLEDSIVDNLLRMAFFSKYQAWRTREKGLGTALLEGWRPPTKAIDAVTRDIINEAQGKDRGWELWRSVPIAGENYYWWFGEGRKKIERKEGKKSTWVD